MVTSTFKYKDKSHLDENKCNSELISDDMKINKVRLILNKITSNTFMKLFQDLLNLDFYTMDLLEKVVKEVNEKASKEEDYSYMYVYLQSKIRDDLNNKNDIENVPSKNDFNRIFLNKLQEDYQNTISMRYSEIDNLDISNEDKEKKKMDEKRSYFGNILLIGESFLQGILHSRIVLKIMNDLINKGIGSYNNDKFESQNYFESLKRLIKIIGNKMLEINNKYLDKDFRNLQDFYNTNCKKSSYLNSQIKDILEYKNESNSFLDPDYYSQRNDFLTIQEESENMEFSSKSMKNTNSDSSESNFYSDKNVIRSQSSSIVSNTNSRWKSDSEEISDWLKERKVNFNEKSKDIIPMNSSTLDNDPINKVVLRITDDNDNISKEICSLFLESMNDFSENIKSNEEVLNDVKGYLFGKESLTNCGQLSENTLTHILRKVSQLSKEGIDFFLEFFDLIDQNNLVPENSIVCSLKKIVDEICNFDNPGYYKLVINLLHYVIFTKKYKDILYYFDNPCDDLIDSEKGVDLIFQTLNLAVEKGDSFKNIRKNCILPISKDILEKLLWEETLENKAKLLNISLNDIINNFDDDDDSDIDIDAL
jgi:hypothetical protein